MRTQHHGPGVIVSRSDYKNRHYSGPFVARQNQGGFKGYVLWAVSPVSHYPGGSVFRVCAWPDSADGQRRGWRTLRQAQEWARAVNGGELSGFQCSGPFREHDMWQARGFDAWGRHFNRAFPRRAECQSFINAMRRGDNRVARY